VIQAPPLHAPAFRWFFLGQFVSLLGSSMAPVALAFAVMEFSGRASDLGIILAARSIPLLIFLVAGGAIADRFSRSTVLQVANLGAAATQGAVAFLLLSGQYGLVVIAGLEFLNGTLAAFTLPAMRGIVPELVDRVHRQQANSLIGLSQNATAILGPTVAGIVVAGAGGGWAVAADSLSYLLAALCLTRVALPRTVRAVSVSVLADIRDGWRVFQSLTWVKVSVASFAVANCLYVGIWTVLGPTIADGTIGPSGWGLVLSAKATGVLLVSVIMYRVRVVHLLAIGQLCVAAEAIPMIMLGAHPTLPLLTAAAFIAGLGGGIFGIAWETSLQEHVPGDKLSRVSAYDDVGSFIGVPIGQVTAGPIASGLGAGPVSIIGGVLYAAVAASPLLVPSVRRLRQPSAEVTTVSS
jgi:MFS family permease